MESARVGAGSGFLIVDALLDDARAPQVLVCRLIQQRVAPSSPALAGKNGGPGAHMGTGASVPGLPCLGLDSQDRVMAVAGRTAAGCIVDVYASF